MADSTLKCNASEARFYLEPSLVSQYFFGLLVLLGRLDKETVWLTQAQMALLFDTSSDNISLYLKNIYAEQELLENQTTEDYLVVRQEDKRLI